MPTETVVGRGRQGRRESALSGYVLVKMIMTDETWYVVRNARGVTGICGALVQPIPLSEEEVEKLGVETQVRSRPPTRWATTAVQNHGRPAGGESSSALSGYR